MFRVLFLILGLIPLLHLNGKEHKPVNNLMPLAKVNFSPAPLGDIGAVAGGGEFGSRNIRASGTFGAYATPSQRIKLSGEYLTQGLKYPLTASKKHEWLTQYAIGGLYQFILPNETRFMTLDFGIAYSHANSQRLKTKTFFPGHFPS